MSGPHDQSGGYGPPPEGNQPPPGYGYSGGAWPPQAPPPAYGPAGGYPAPVGFPPPPGYEQPPGLALTIVITLFFGLFGLIPAALGASKAGRLGYPQGRYWVAFGASLAGSLAVWGVLLFALLTAGMSALPSGVTSDAGAAATPSFAAPSQPAAPSAAAPSGSGGATTNCAFSPDTSGNPNLVDVGTPPSFEPAVGQTSLTLTTNFGPIPLTLDYAKAPCAAGSFVYLAEHTFFDGTRCHREVNQPDFGVLQCGDPTGTGSGGPTYTYPTHVTGQEQYSRGTIAMANSGQGSDSSQFFLCFTDAQLPPDYTVVGSVSPEGLAVLDKIAAKGNDGSFEPSPGGGAPTTPVTIQKATVG